MQFIKNIILVILALTLVMPMQAGKKMKAGIYRGILTLNAEKQVELPFNFEIIYRHKKPVMILHNAEERLETSDILQHGDSVRIRSSVFDTEFSCKITSEGLQGVWINHYRSTQNIIPFRATYGESFRFIPLKPLPGPAPFNGRWETTFSPGQDESKAVGIFRHIEQTDEIFGTFLTETGDYRYLEGCSKGNQLLLSAFDGSHAFLFTAEINQGVLSGTFYSGMHYSEPWTAVKNEQFQLRDAESITAIKNPDVPFAFTFNDLQGQPVSLSDQRFRNKPVIIQLMGSWCPNCMDESAFLTGIYNDYHSKGLEIIALAFEKTTDPQTATRQVQRLVQRLGISYPVLLTLQTGKDKATETMKNLSSVSAFPTTIFLNRQHQAVKVHTGFSGPATGEEFTRFRTRTINLINSLLQE